MARAFKLGLGQMLVEGGQAEANLERAEALIAQAAEEECEAVLLPECLDLGWTHPGVADLAESIPGPWQERLGQAARQHGLWVVAGLTEWAGDRVYNAAVVLDSDGALRLKHRKINVLDIARDQYAIGDRLGVCESPFGILGTGICADHFPNTVDLGSALARMGAEVLLSPCAWAVPADHDNDAEPYGDLWRESYGRLAKDFGLAVVGVSNVGTLDAGPWEGRRCIGCSLAVDADGTELVQLPYGADAHGLWTVTVTPKTRTALGTEFTAR